MTRTLTEEEKQYRRDYYQANKGRMNAQMKAWRLENRDRHLQMTRDWYQKNRDQHLANSARWASENLDKKASARRRRRSVIAGSEGTSSLEQVAARVAYFGTKCAYCGGPYEEVDHVIPLAKGGTNWPSNLRPSCVSCNRRKHTKSLSEWRAR